MNKVLTQEEIDALFSAISLGSERAVAKQRCRALSGKKHRTERSRNVDMILRLKLPLSICFRNCRMSLQRVLKLAPGSVIELNKSVRDPVTVFVNHKPVARGELVIVNGCHGVHILKVESTAKRIRSLG